MPLLYSEAKTILSKFAGAGGQCPGTKSVDLFVREVLQFMLYQGSYGNERKFCFNAENGCFTIPYELETPLKVKVDGRVGSVWDKWYEFHSTSILDGCIAAQDALFEDTNEYSTVYDLPTGGAQIGAVPTIKENSDCFIIIQGEDPTGREIITYHNGERLVGEKLTPVWGQNVYTQSTFGRVTSVYKSITNGYLNLVWNKPDKYLKGFLADYSPLEQKPAYRRFQLTAACACKHSLAKVSVIGRIRLKENYTDNDRIPFDNIYALSLAGQTINANYREKIDIAAAKTKMLGGVVNQENSYKKVNPGLPIEVYRPLSGGSIKGVNR